MKIEYKTNFSGYFVMLRAIQYLPKNKMLSFAELGAYICLIAQADYDNRHKTYGVIIRDDKEIAKELSCDPTAIYRHRKKLIKLGLLTQTSEGYTKIPNFYLYELKWVQLLAKIPSTHLQELFTNPQENLDGLQRIIAKLQDKQLQNAPQSSIVSSNDNLSYSQGFHEELDIDKIQEGIGDEKGVTHES